MIFFFVLFLLNEGIYYVATLDVKGGGGVSDSNVILTLNVAT